MINVRTSLLSVALVWSGIACSQGTGPLTPEDGAQITEALPEVLEWGKKGGCPVVMLRGEYPNVLWYSVHRFCSLSEGGGVIGHFVVDRWTGEIGTAPDNDKVFDSDTLRELRRRQLKKRYAARVSPHEAACIVRWMDEFQQARCETRCPSSPWQ